jgi:hypothetical protein
VRTRAQGGRREVSSGRAPGQGLDLGRRDRGRLGGNPGWSARHPTSVVLGWSSAIPVVSGTTLELPASDDLKGGGVAGGGEGREG